ncbi:MULTISPECIES: lytic murein transglycosylase [Rhodomicrobium]|uniref:lytic murein transglycosylase n=1 Tax=Rhodomicrobium TaxID=1068 RepID=UPI001FD9CFAC|nr:MULTISPECIES: lytic murein transglycosylase [Rhodomicrobium]
MAAECGRDGSGFDAWLEHFKSKAAAQGISRATLSTALDGLTYDRKVIGLDRGQRSFKLSFEQFYARRVSSGLIARGRKLMSTHAATFSRIEQKYGVPAPILIAIWGLETSYGADSGNFPIIRSLATLAYDCRRTEFFQNELMSALRIVERGDLTPAQLRGGWAGEIGQTQFLSSSYVKYAVDFDGNGHRDLVRSVPDLLASTANYLKAKGWQAGQGWQPGSANYAVLQEWNKAQVYVQTIGVMANKIAGRS